MRFPTRREIIESYILKRTLKGIQALTDTYEAEGEEYRTQNVNSVQRSILQLHGKSNVLERTIEETKSQIVDVEKGLKSEISQTAEEIRTEVSNTEKGLKSEIRQNADSITAEVKRAKGQEEELSSSIKINADSITEEVKRASKAEGEMSASIRLNAEEIGLKVSKDNVIGSINLSSEKAVISAKKIELKGAVSFSAFSDDLQESYNDLSSDASDAKAKTDGLSKGTTTINGGCIETGTIGADKIKAGELDALKIKAGSVDGETISGKHLSGCSGDMTSLFLWDKKASLQHGSICGQYMDDNGNIKQVELIRVNNASQPELTVMNIYRNMYHHVRDYFNEGSGNGIMFGNPAFGGGMLPAYINTLKTSSMTGTAAIRFGFLKSSNEVPAFEIYDNYNNNANAHEISAKVFGNLTVNGTIADQSSRRYKTNISDLPEETAFNLLKYRIVSFDYKDGRTGKHGMIAEEAVKVSEYAVVKDTQNRPDAIGYVSFIPDMIKLNQLMYEKIESLEKELGALKERCQALERKCECSEQSA